MRPRPLTTSAQEASVRVSSGTDFTNNIPLTGFRFCRYNITIALKALQKYGKQTRATELAEWEWLNHSGSGLYTDACISNGKLISRGRDHFNNNELKHCTYLFS